MLSDLQLWYSEKMRICKPVCENCNSKIRYGGQSWFNSQAHILPKSIFHSIATHHDNHMVLGMWCNCHGQYDSSWLNASKMPVFKIAMERFKKFDHLIINREERRKIPEIFLYA